MPQTPYRAGKALAEIIPPDRRRLKAAALVVSSMVTGALLWVLGGMVLDMVRGERIIDLQPQPGSLAGHITPSILRGPRGSVALPPVKRTVVNVWLQGCSDCMPAFDAMAALQGEGGLGADIPVINVAYGEADPTWAQRYGVGAALVFDPGGQRVVKPLGISTFTTLVVDPDGSIVHRDRPDRQGYAARVRQAMDLADRRDEQPLRPEDVERVIASQRAGLRRICWERAPKEDGPSSVSVTVQVTLARDGSVSDTASNGNSPALARCIEGQVRTWRFPPPGSTRTLNIPFKFVRE